MNAGTLDPLGRTAAMAGPERLAAYKSLFDVNFFALVSLAAHALPYLKETSSKPASDVAGRIVMVSSGAATGGVAGWGAYSASKAALNSLVRTLGNEEPEVVTVAVRPGVLEGDMQAAIRTQGPDHMLPKELEVSGTAGWRGSGRPKTGAGWRLVEGLRWEDLSGRVRTAR